MPQYVTYYLLHRYTPPPSLTAIQPSLYQYAPQHGLSSSILGHYDCRFPTQMHCLHPRIGQLVATTMENLSSICDHKDHSTPSDHHRTHGAKEKREKTR